MRLLTLTDEREYQVWAFGIADLPDAAIRAGLAKAKDFSGFLSLGAFRELCHVKPEDLGLPDAQSAYREAAMSDGPRDRIQWSHPAVYHAGRETGWFELRQGTEREIFPLFRRNYEAMCARVMAGEQLDMPVQKALPEHVPCYLDPDENKSRMAALKEMLV